MLNDLIFEFGKYLNNMMYLGILIKGGKNYEKISTSFGSWNFGP
jgi:hypothetical protein